MLQISKQHNPFNLFYFVLAEKATLLSQLIFTDRWGWPSGSLAGMLPLFSCLPSFACCPGRSLPTQRPCHTESSLIGLSSKRSKHVLSFRIYTFCIHPSERILALGDMKTFCVWGMSRIFCGASWLAILSFIGQLWTHHYCQISFPPFLGWDLRAKRIFCKCYF